MKGKENLGSSNFIYPRLLAEINGKQNETKMSLHLHKYLLLTNLCHTLVTGLSLQGWTIKPGYQLVFHKIVVSDK